MLDSVDTLIAFILIMLMVSLLITIAVQLTVTALNLRGVNLLSGLASTFAVIDPNIEKKRKELARFVLRSRLLSDSFLPNWSVLGWWRRASAARPQEIFDAIHRIAIGKEPVGKDPRNPTPSERALKDNATSLLIALGMDEQTLADATKKITDAEERANTLAANANKALDSILDANIRQKVQTEVNTAVTSVTSALRTAGTAAADQIVAAAGTIDAAYKKFHKWTCICEERAQQWLTMHTRILTIIFAFVAAFCLQLDTVEIFRFVSSNKLARDKLVAQAGVVEAQAARVLGDSSSVLKDALKDWSEKQTDPAVKSALAGIEVNDTDTREEVQAKVIKALNGETPIDSFDSIVNAAATRRVEKQAANFKTVKADLDKTGFDVFPQTEWRWEKGWWNGCRQHFWGILFSVGLLSLGAPFWYNALKNLTNLRSVVAQNISKEKEQAAKKPDAGEPKPPPL
jgi:dUTPase